MKKTVFIVSGGRIDDRAFVKGMIGCESDASIICADGGAGLCADIGVIPFAIVGDMDSIDKSLLRFFEEKGTEILRYPKEKDKTDTELALEKAIAMEPGRIVLFGALGNRIDHSLANISLLVAGPRTGIDFKIIDENCELFATAGTATVSGLPGHTVSLFPLSEEVTGITLSGFEYPLSNAVMKLGHPYGISNSLAGSEGLISIGSGYLLVVHYHNKME